MFMEKKRGKKDRTVTMVTGLRLLLVIVNGPEVKNLLCEGNTGL